MNMNKIPKATHSGTWVIDEENDIKIECYVMDNKETIALMKASDTWEEFDKLFRKAMGEPVQLELSLKSE